MASKSFLEVMDMVLGKANEDIYLNPEKFEFIDDILDLPKELQDELFNMLWQALGMSIEYQVSRSDSIVFPSIGTFKIKEFNAIALRIKLEVANELGFDTWDFINSETIVKARIIADERIKKEFLEVKRTGGLHSSINEDRVIKSKTRIFKLNVK